MRCQATGKVRHRCQRHAEIAMAMAQHEHNDVTLNAYPCDFCGDWHVGRMHGKLARKVAPQRLVALIERAVKQDEMNHKSKGARDARKAV